MTEDEKRALLARVKTDRLLFTREVAMPESKSEQPLTTFADVIQENGKLLSDSEIAAVLRITIPLSEEEKQKNAEILIQWLNGLSLSDIPEDKLLLQCENALKELEETYLILKSMDRKNYNYPETLELFFNKVKKYRINSEKLLKSIPENPDAVSDAGSIPGIEIALSDENILQGKLRSLFPLMISGESLCNLLPGYKNQEVSIIVGEKDIHMVSSFTFLNGVVDEVWLGQSIHGGFEAIKCSRKIESQEGETLKIMNLLNDTQFYQGKMKVLAMPLVSGVPLQDFYQEANAAFDPRIGPTLVKAGLKLLMDLEKNRIVHGDIQVGNVFLQDNKMNIIDFGEAAMAGEKTLSTGAMIFRAPEGLRAKSNEANRNSKDDKFLTRDPRTDSYAMGILLAGQFGLLKRTNLDWLRDIMAGGNLDPQYGIVSVVTDTDPEFLNNTAIPVNVRLDVLKILQELTHPKLDMRLSASEAMDKLSAIEKKWQTGLEGVATTVRVEAIGEYKAPAPVPPVLEEKILTNNTPTPSFQSQDKENKEEKSDKGSFMKNAMKFMQIRKANQPVENENEAGMQDNANNKNGNNVMGKIRNMLKRN